jgi:hypothetical protein
VLEQTVPAMTPKYSVTDRNNPNRQVNAFVNGGFVSMKSMELYSAIKRFTVEQVSYISAYFRFYQKLNVIIQE